MPPPRTIGLRFNPDQPWYQRVFAGIVRYAEKKQDWLLEFLYSEPISAETKPDGLIFGFSGDRIGSPDCPHIFLSSTATPCVAIDQQEAGSMAAEHLIEQGYRNLLFFQTGQSKSPNPFLREQGFKEKARQDGIDVTQFVSEAYHQAEDGTTLELGECIRRLPKPLGICACDPYYTKRLHFVCQQKGYRIPEDIGIISPKEHPFLFPYLKPGISAVYLNHEKVGYEAARLLDRQLNGETIPIQTLIPPQYILVRGSTDHRVIADPHCEKIVNFIWDHLEDSLDTADLAKQFHMSESSLYRQFSKHVGRTPSEELRHARIETAKRLLWSTRLPLIQIALECGYGGQSQFNRDFKKATGMTPGSFRN